MVSECLRQTDVDISISEGIALYPDVGYITGLDANLIRRKIERTITKSLLYIVHCVMLNSFGAFRRVIFS